MELGSGGGPSSASSSLLPLGVTRFVSASAARSDSEDVDVPSPLRSATKRGLRACDVKPD